jgi:hypothetical protein
MKKILWLRGLFLGTLVIRAISFSCAQQVEWAKTKQHELTDKYWFYRQRLNTEFLKVGLGVNGEASGHALPAAQAYVGEGDQLHFGDATSFLGNYIGVLATEYLLLKRDSASPEQLVEVKQELFYAMKAYERLDYNAELLLPPHQIGSVNGFFIRDDVNPQTYGQDFQTPLDVTGTPKVFVSDYGDAQHQDPCKRYPLRFPSVDQIANLMVGFALVVKCMDDAFFEDYVFKEKAKFYTHAIMQYMQNVDYVIAHPTADCPVAFAEDGRLIAYGLAQAGQAIRDERFGTEPLVQFNRLTSSTSDYDSWSTFISSSVWINTLNYPSGKAFFEANFNTSDGERSTRARIQSSVNEYGIFGIFDAHDYNNAIVCQLAAIGNVWKIGLEPHNRRVTLLSLKKWNRKAPLPLQFSHEVSLQRRPAAHVRQLTFPVCCYDGSVPQQMVGLLSSVMHRKVPLADLSSQLVTALPTLCMPGHDVLPRVTINTTALALSQYGDLSDIQYFAALHEFLHGKGTYTYDKDFLFMLLKEAPATGPHHKPYRDPNNPPSDFDWSKRSESEGSPWWRQDSRWEKSSRKRDPTHGAWNGLDYMIAYNIFHLVHGKAYGLMHYVPQQ